MNKQKICKIIEEEIHENTRHMNDFDDAPFIMKAFNKGLQADIWLIQANREKDLIKFACLRSHKLIGAIDLPFPIFEAIAEHYKR